MKIILVDAWNTLFTESGTDSEMIEILDSFPNKKIVLTNANDEQVIEMGIDKSPYDFFTLKHNPNKADGGFYEKFIEEKSLVVEDLIYFEHSKEAVEKARGIGINTYHFNKDKRDLIQLKEFLKNNL